MISKLGHHDIGQQACGRYAFVDDYAQEYLEVCYKLWEGSWEEGAILRDRERRVSCAVRRGIPVTSVSAGTLLAI